MNGTKLYLIFIHLAHYALPAYSSSDMLLQSTAHMDKRMRLMGGGLQSRFNIYIYIYIDTYIKFEHP